MLPLLRDQGRAEVFEDGPRAVEPEIEAPELQVGHLMGGHHLEPVEVFHLGGVPVHHHGQVHRAPFCGRVLPVNPADALAHQLLGHGDVHRSP